MNRFKAVVLAALAATVAIGGAIMYGAPSASAQGSAALSITPRKNYTIEPGKGVNDTLVVRNLDSERDLTLSLRVVDFTFTDDGGTPKLMLAEDAPQTTWSLKPFMKVPETVTVKAGASQRVDMGINIPKNQGAGSFYSAIVYSSGSSEGGNVGLSASGVTLAFVTVPGKMNEKLTVEKLGAYDAQERDYQFFNVNMPSRVAYTLKNSGNVVESPVGSITLRDLFGRETKINQMNPNSSLALIGQTRTFESCIKLKKEEVDFNGSRQEAATCADAGLWPGIYRVELNGFYGQNGNNTQELIGKSLFVYLPLWFIIIALIVLAFLGYHIWRIVRYIQTKRGGGRPPVRKRMPNVKKRR